MNKETFIKTHCHNCGTQRCEGINSEWFEGCRYKWDLDGLSPAEEIERLNKMIMDLAAKLVSKEATWEQDKFPYDRHWRCSHCGNLIIVEYTTELTKYCCDCGCKMTNPQLIKVARDYDF